MTNTHVILNNETMNYRRAVTFGALLWLTSFIVYLILNLIPGLFGRELLMNIGFWILLVPITLFWSKWYFKQDPPSFKKGIRLGVVALLTAFVLDIVFLLGTGQRDMFIQLYTDWKLYVAVLEILLLTSFAGWEYDRTYTKRTSS